MKAFQRAVTSRARVLVILTLVSLVGMLLGAVPAPALPVEPELDTSAQSNAAAAAEPWWVEWLAAFDQNGNRIDDEAEEIARNAEAAGNPGKLVPVLVSFSEAPSQDEVEAFLARLEAGPSPYTFKTQPMIDLDVPAGNLLDLASEPGVVAVEYDYPLHPVLDVSAPATQANNGVAPNDFYNGLTAEDLGYTGENMTVAVLDTGVQQQHEAFNGKWLAGIDVSVAIPPSPLCIDPVDEVGHGTHVASTAVGAMSADHLFGTAKDAKLVEVKIGSAVSLGGSNRGFEFVRRYNEAVAPGGAPPYCGPNDDRIDVATLSFGSVDRGGPTAGSSEAFIDALVNSGVAVTIAVGNCGPTPSATCTFGDDENGISSPGNAAGAIGVANFNDGATVSRDNDVIAASSSRGPNSAATGVNDPGAAGGATSASNLADRYRKPDVAAPGTGINAAGLTPGSRAEQSGTSMAAPHVAGIATLLLQAGEQAKSQTGGINLMASTGNSFKIGTNTTLTYQRSQYPVRDAIIRSTDYTDFGIPPGATEWTGANSFGLDWNNAWGYGQVNAFGALCWAWDNVLGPGGATRPQPILDLCGLPEPPPPPIPNPCELPGVTIATDPQGDFTNPATTNPELDIRSLHVAEPGSFGPGKVVFTLKMQSMANPPPDSTWPIQFDYPAGTRRFVRMHTNPTGQVFFTYGTGTATSPITAPGSPADPQSGFDPDGTIRIVVGRSNIGNPTVGDTLTSFLVRVRSPEAGLAPTPDNMPNSLDPVGSYEIVGSENCNLPPIARPDEATTYESRLVTIDPLANDEDPEGDLIDLADVADPGHGSVSISGENVEYTPDPGFVGDDSFTYQVCDSEPLCAVGIITVHVLDDAVAPSCTVISQTRSSIVVRVQDAHSGLKEIVVTSSKNMKSVTWPPFQPGAHSVDVTGTKKNTGQDGEFSLSVTDLAGNQTGCTASGKFKF